MTRGREDNVAHLIAENLDDARQLWVETFSRDRADLGPGHAAMRAAEDLDRYAPQRPLEAALGDLRAAWTRQQDLRSALARTERQRHFMAGFGDPAYEAEFQAAVDEIRDELTNATHQVHALLHEPALRSLPPGGSSKNTTTGSKTANTNGNSQPKPTGRSATPSDQATTNPPTATRAHPTQGSGISR